MPPVSIFMEMVARRLRAIGRKPRVQESPLKAAQMTFGSLTDIVRHVLAVPEEHISNAEFASYVFPTVIEIADENGVYVCDRHIIFFCVRNRSGREWIYTRYQNSGPVPTDLVDSVAQAMTEALAARKNLESDDVPMAEYESAQTVLQTIVDGVDAALSIGMHAMPQRRM
jgi:hypothetical protein